MQRTILTLRLFVQHSNVLVGVVAVGFAWGNCVLLGLSASTPLLVLAFCATFLVYQLERAIQSAPEDVRNQPERIAWVRAHRTYVWLSSAVAVVVSILCLFYLRQTTIVAGMGLAVLSLAYALPVLPGRRRLKTLWFMKPLAIAGAWTVGGVWLPALEAGEGGAAGLLPLVAYRFCFVLPNVLLADWPDREGDAHAGLSTPALRLSQKQLRYIGLASLLLALLVSLWLHQYVAAGWLLAIDLVGVGWMMWAVVEAPIRSRWFYGVVIDLIVGWPAVTAGAWLIFRSCC